MLVPDGAGPHKIDVCVYPFMHPRGRSAGVDDVRRARAGHMVV